MVLSSQDPTLSLVMMIFLAMSIWLFFSVKTANPVNATTQPAGMLPYIVSIMVKLLMVLFSWKPSEVNTTKNITSSPTDYPSIQHLSSFFPGAKNGNVNLQISGVSTGSTLKIQLKSSNLKDENNEGFACQNITADYGEVNAIEDAWGNMYSDDGKFSVKVGNEDFGDLFQISIVQQPGEEDALNLWKSSVELIDA